MKQLDLFGFWEEPQKEEVKETQVPVPSADASVITAAEVTTGESVDSPDTIVVNTVAVPDDTGTANQLLLDVTNEESVSDEYASEETSLYSDIETDPVEDIILASIEQSHSVPAKVIETNAAAPAPLMPETVSSTNNSPVVFDDGKITVKIKRKQPPVEEPAVVPITEPQVPAVEQKEIPSAPPVPAIIKEVEKRPILVVVKKRGRKSFKEIDAEVELVEVPDDEVLFSKQYYAISQVAKWFHVNTSLVRYWENEFDVLKPRKNRKGDRLFRPEDIKNLQVIYYLLRQRKFSIEGAKKYLKENRKNADTNVQLIQSLTKFRSFLLELKANLGV